MVHIPHPRSKVRIDQIAPDLYLVTLPIPMSGFDGFIGSWIYTGNPSLVVDVGPAVSMPALLSALAELGLTYPDLVLLTHIHIDHAGGAGTFVRHLPRTALVCHPKAIDHLTAPDQLWQGTRKILGAAMADAYAPFEAVAPKAIIGADQLQTPEIIALATPGHAPHHYAFLLKNEILFAGEAAGICLSVPHHGYLRRPATPPRFFMDTYLDSLDRLGQLPARMICFGHLSHRDQPRDLISQHREQIKAWRHWLLPLFEQSPDDPRPVMDDCLDLLLTKDPLLVEFQYLPAAVQVREKNFLQNSIKGYWGQLAVEKQADPR